jgi:hypothetical protein
MNREKLIGPRSPQLAERRGVVVKRNLEEAWSD